MICLHCTSATACTIEPHMFVTMLQQMSVAFKQRPRPSSSRIYCKLSCVCKCLTVQMSHCDYDQSTDNDRLYMCSDVHLRTSTAYAQVAPKRLLKKDQLKDPKWSMPNTTLTKVKPAWRNRRLYDTAAVGRSSDTCAMRCAAQRSFHFFSPATAWQQYCMHGI